MNNSSKNSNMLSSVISMVSSAFIEPFLFIGYLMSLFAGFVFRIVLSVTPQIVIDFLRYMRAAGNEYYDKFKGFVDFVQHCGENELQSKKRGHIIHANHKNNAGKNEKLLILQNKIRSLEESIFEETNEKRKMEKELNHTKIQYAEKDAELSREHDENVDNIRKVTLLDNVVKTVHEELEKEKSKSILYQEEIKKVEMELKALRAEERKQSKDNERKHKKESNELNKGKEAQQDSSVHEKKEDDHHKNEGEKTSSGTKTPEEFVNDDTNSNKKNKTKK